LTPHARVAVQQSTRTTPAAKSFSTRFLRELPPIRRNLNFPLPVAAEHASVMDREAVYVELLEFLVA
jgi:hypothetical protein